MDTSEDQYKLLFKNESETKFFAFQLAKIIQPKDVIALNGDLGTGKTVFARAFVEAVTGEDASGRHKQYKNCQNGTDSENIILIGMRITSIATDEEIIYEENGQVLVRMN